MSSSSPSELLRYEIELPHTLLPFLESALEPWVVSLQIYPLKEELSRPLNTKVATPAYIDEDSSYALIWRVIFWCLEENLPEKGLTHALQRSFKVLSKIELPPPQKEDLSKDWVMEVYKSLPPLKVGPFTIAGDHENLSPLEKKDPFFLQINASVAFGTGHHPTTRGCLHWLNHLQNQTARPLKILDIGCGSGILSLASARLFPEASLYATDIDPQALEMAKFNAQKNNIPPQNLSFFPSEGPIPQSIIQEGPYDLILANILLRPLLALAPDIDALAREGTFVVLSGFLMSDLPVICQTYHKNNIEHTTFREEENWCASLLQKSFFSP